MDLFEIEGGVTLEGAVPNHGAKNAVLPILAAGLLTEDVLRVENAPDLSDVNTMVDLLRGLGAGVERNADGSIEVRAAEGISGVAPWEQMRRMRASFCVLGPLLGRLGKAEVSLPGGCVLGLRPIDMHIKGLVALGGTVSTARGDIHAVAPEGGLVGGDVFVGTPSGSSVGATMNVMMAAVLARGRTRIQPAACEPEVTDLAECLISMGARITGAGSPVIEIDGVEGLHGATHQVVPDRIEAGTYLIAGAITGGRVRVEGCQPRHLAALFDSFASAGVSLSVGEDWAEVLPPAGTGNGFRSRPTDITTQPHPGFPTDLQAQWTALMAMAEGTSIITERIYPDRYMHLAELNRLGAHIRRQGASVIVEGVPSMSGAQLMASDLRASAALVLAGLVARDTTEVHRVYHIDRGYERIDSALESLGARVRRRPE